MNPPASPRLRLSAFVSAAILTSSLLFSSSHAHASTLYSQGLSLGDAGPLSGHHWAVFSLGGKSDYIDTETEGLIVGDVGVAGNGNFDILNLIPGAVSITGGIYYETGGTVSNYGLFGNMGSAGILGGKTSNAATNAILSQGVKDAETLSAKASALTATAGGPTNITAGTTLGNGGGGNYVFKLTNFTLTGPTSVLKLDGNSSSSFVFDISGTFNVEVAAKIVLEGGLTASNVLFNYDGTKEIEIGGAASVSGIILAAGPNYLTSSVNVSGGSSVTGEVIASQVVVGVGSTITQSVVSP